ncbi:unnamed protein product, partial [Symbiodinium sp. CCMP2456]
DKGFDEPSEQVANAQKFLALALARWESLEKDLGLMHEKWREAIQNGDKEGESKWESKIEIAESKIDKAKVDAEKKKEELEKAKSTAPLQAKAALRVIKEEELDDLSQVRVPAAKVQDGQTLVGIDACLTACMGFLKKYINQSDGS